MSSDRQPQGSPPVEPTVRADVSDRPSDNGVDFWVFDLDGTLIDTASGYRRGLFDRIGDRLDYRFSDREADTVWYGLGEGREQCLRAVGIDPGRFWSVFHDVEDASARAEATYLFDDSERLAGLDGPLGLVTHCQQYLTDPVLEALDIADWFDAIVCCSDATGWKPDAEPVERAMAEMGVGPSTARGVMVGDDPYDTGAAWNAGLESVHVQRYDPAQRGQCVLGDRRIDSLWELPP